MRLIAVDPGDVYTGVAFFDSPHDRFTKWEDWSCVGAVEFGPDEFEDAFAETLVAGDVQIVVYERFMLYEGKALEQSGSEFRAVQTIGVIRWLVRNHNAHVVSHLRGEKMACTDVHESCKLLSKGETNQEVIAVGQLASIKTPARGILRSRGIKSTAKPIARKQYKGRDHVVDAELHGFYWLMKADPSLPARQT